VRVSLTTFLAPLLSLLPLPHQHRPSLPFVTTIIFFFFFEKLVTTIISFKKNKFSFLINFCHHCSLQPLSITNLCHLSIQPPSSQFSSTPPPSLSPSSLPHLRLDLRTLLVASLSSLLTLSSSISHHLRPHPPPLSVVFNLKSYHHCYPPSSAILSIYSLYFTLLQNALTRSNDEQ